jgi:hypothetical protein
MVGNPNHDPRTGKFTSASGLNRANSTLTQRGKARVKEHISAAKAFAAGAAGIAVAGVGAALLQGVTKPVRVHATVIANKAIMAGIGHAEHLVATHGPTIAKAIKSKGSTLISHVKNMKMAGSTQHQPIQPKPRIRVPAGRQVVPPSKPMRAPRRRK